MFRLDIESETVLIPVLHRESPFDCLLAKSAIKSSPQGVLASLAESAVIGTSSMRRTAEIKRLRPDIEVVPLRGNVPTRIKKLRESSEIDAIILAQAGLDRLGVKHNTQITIGAEEMMPASNQGILLAQFVRKRSDLFELVRSLVDPHTECCWQAERTCISILGADCHSALGVYAEVRAGEIVISSRVLSNDGQQQIERKTCGDPSQSSQLAKELADQLMEAGASSLL